MECRNHSERGQPGGRGRRHEVGRTGIWPVSGLFPAGNETPVVGQGELGQGSRGAAGQQDSGESELIACPTDPVCGAHVNPKHAAASGEYDGGTDYFDSDACRRRFEQPPEHYSARARRAS